MTLDIHLWKELYMYTFLVSNGSRRILSAIVLSKLVWCSFCMSRPTHKQSCELFLFKTRIPHHERIKVCTGDCILIFVATMESSRKGAQHDRN
jgi:hypothetical protein